ncbi:GumC family protein [Cognatitamlana onchidii]|uniref:GumC family protein n=1 Tax=Cognatitamlana onchidii TaxID=2562860 RepID=UPI001455F6AA|nr:tyrosine-protein kinase family protein [Algibacter onchidii]
MNDRTNSGGRIHERFDLKKSILLYLKHWKWFVFSILFCFALGYLKERYTTPLYSATAKILLLDNENNSGNSVLKDLSILSEQDNSQVEDEIQVIRSRSFMRNIVKKLNLNVQVFAVGNINESEIYGNNRLKINFIESDSIIERTNAQFYLNVISDKSFGYKVDESDDYKTYKINDTVPTNFGGMIISDDNNNGVFQFIGSNLKVKITPVQLLAESLKNRIAVFPSGSKGSKVVDIYLEDHTSKKAIDIINTLIDEYNLSTLKKSKLRSQNTANFINQRVQSIAQDLINVEDSIVRYKSANKITDISSKSGNLASSSLTGEQQLQQLKIQLNMLNYMKNKLNNNNYENLPSNLGGEDPTIIGLSTRYNELLEQRRSVLKSAGENNTVVLQLNETLNSIKDNLAISIDNNINTLNIQIRGIQNQLSALNSKISSVPVQESKLLSIGRRQSIKEQLYLYLLQKREEAEISQTTTLPSAKIIEPAYDLGPVSGNKMVTYFGAIFVGFLIPFLVIYIVDLLDTKIHNKEDLQNEIYTIPVLGEIPNVKGGDKNLIKKNDRSILSESFRIIKTNFDFIRKTNKESVSQRNVFFVTSTINGEGKSFVSLNTALTSSNSGNKVLLIGADLRNPQIYSAIKTKTEVESKFGLSEYLADTNLSLDEIINTYKINDIEIDIMLSGKIPPNPAELLMGDRMKNLFDVVSNQYDVVIVDTAPSMLVTDTLLISEYASYTIYLVRAGYTEKRILNFAKELHQENKLNKMMFVVNDVKESNFGYGAKYGYYGKPERKSFFGRFSVKK